jgi:2-dehydro-3-deoxygluconokinase
MTSVVCFGEMLLRLSPDGVERLFQAPSLRTWFGGSEVNVAISLSRFGVASRCVTRVPDNPIGDAAIRTLRAEGVDTDHVWRGGDRMGIYFAEGGAGSRPPIVTYDRTASSFSTIDPFAMDWASILAGASWLHLSGITPALGAGPAACAADAMAAARLANITVSFDLNYRASLWPVDAAAPVLQTLAGHADVLFASEDHLLPLLGVSPGVDAGRHVALQYGPKYVAITSRESRSAEDNSVGAVLWDAAATALYIAPRYDVRIVDRIGAGDAFAAGLLYGLNSGRDPAEALRFAVAAGALKHTIPGDANLVSVAEVERLANGDASGLVQR